MRGFTFATTTAIAVALMIGLTLSFANANAAPSKAIDPKNLEPGCNENNAPALQLDGERLLIDDGHFENIKYVPCDNSNMGYRIRKSMMNLGKMFGFNSRSQWGPSVIGTNPYNFVMDRIEYLQIIYKEDEHCDWFTNGYFQDLTGKDPKKFRSVTICPSAKYNSDVNLMALMLHEARHADDKSHTTCTYGPIAMLKDKYACDSSFEDAGAYAVSTEFYLAASKHPSLTPAQRQSARSSGIQLLIGRFNKLPKGLQFASVLFPAAGGAYVFDGQREIKIISALPAGYQLMLRPSNPVLVQKNTGKTVSYAFSPEKLAESVDQVLEDFDKKLRPTFVDQAEFGDMSCYLFAHKLACWNLARDKNAVWDFSNREASRFLLLDQSMLNGAGRTGVVAYLITKDGAAIILPSSYAEMDKDGPDFTVENRKAREYAAAIRDTVTFTKDSGSPYQNLAISHKGLSLIYVDWRDKTGQVPNITTLPLKRLIGPTVWSPLIEQL